MIYIRYVLVWMLSSCLLSFFTTLIAHKINKNLFICYLLILFICLLHFILVKKFYKLYKFMVSKSSDMRLELYKGAYYFSKFSQRYGFIINLFLYLLLTCPFVNYIQSEKKHTDSIFNILFILNLFFFIIQFRLVLIYFNLKYNKRKER